MIHVAQSDLDLGSYELFVMLLKIGLCDVAAHIAMGGVQEYCNHCKWF